MLRNRKEQETLHLRGVELSSADLKLEIGRFRQLQNWIPGGLHSIKKKRGVQQLVSSASVEFPDVCGPGGGGPEEGDISYECGALCPLGQYAQVTYNGSDTTLGVFIRGESGMTAAAVTALAAIYVPSTDVIALVLYDGEALPSSGTTLGLVSHTIASGEVFRLEADDETLGVYRVTVNGVSVITDTLTDEQLSTLNPCTGVLFPDDAELVISEDDAVVIIKTIDQSVASSTTLVDDTELQFPIGANEKWVAYITLLLIADDGIPDIRYTVSAPVGATGKITDINQNYDSVDLGTEATFSLDTFVTVVYLVVSVDNGATAGDVKFQFAQLVSNSANTTVKAFSSMTAHRQI